MRPFTVALSLFTALLLMAPACDSAAGDDPGSYDLVLEGEPFSGPDPAWPGSRVSCKINTSYPESDPLRGKYFVNASNFEDRGFSVLLHFRALESAPPAGSYEVGPEVALQGSYTDPDDGLVGGTIAQGLVTVADEGAGFRMTFAGTPGLTGSIVCPSR